MELENLTRESFAENLNTKFRLTEAGEPRELELIEVSELSHSNRAERFSLIFRGAPDFFLQQRTYKIEHEKLGALELFLVAIGREQDGYRYEAVFNRFNQDNPQG